MACSPHTKALERCIQITQRGHVPVDGGGIAQDARREFSALLAVVEASERLMAWSGRNDPLTFTECSVCLKAALDRLRKEK